MLNKVKMSIIDFFFFFFGLRLQYEVYSYHSKLSGRLHTKLLFLECEIISNFTFLFISVYFKLFTMIKHIIK